MLFHSASIIWEKILRWSRCSFRAFYRDSIRLTYTNWLASQSWLWRRLSHLWLNCLPVCYWIFLFIIILRGVFGNTYVVLHFLSWDSTTVDTIGCRIICWCVCSLSWTLQLSWPPQTTSNSWCTTPNSRRTTRNAWLTRLLVLSLQSSSCPLLWFLERSNLERLHFNLRYFVLSLILKIIFNFPKSWHFIIIAMIISTSWVFMSCILLSVRLVSYLLSTKLYLLHRFRTLQCAWCFLRTETSWLYLCLSTTFCFLEIRFSHFLLSTQILVLRAHLSLSQSRCSISQSWFCVRIWLIL